MVIANGVIDSAEAIDSQEGEIPVWVTAPEAAVHGESTVPDGFGAYTIRNGDEELIVVVWEEADL